MPTGTRGLPAYSITQVEVIDEDGYKRYRELAQVAVLQYGGRFLIQGGTPVVAKGDWPPQQRVVVIEFPSMDQLKAWYDSPEYRPARKIAQTALRRRLLFLEGKDAPTA
jgi:uncharacterized protein (DUF1330 family)